MGLHVFPIRIGDPFLSEYKNPLVNTCEEHYLCVRSDGEMQSHGIKNFFSACDKIFTM